GVSAFGQVVDDDVDVDVQASHFSEDLGNDVGAGFQITNGDFGDVPVQGDSRYDQGFQSLFFGKRHELCPLRLIGFETVAHHDRHAVFGAELDTARMQHFAAEGSHL